MNDFPRPPEFGFRKRTLANGLDVIVRRQPALPIVAVNLWYHVGSKNEERRQRGYAHLFEHLMFEGSEHYPGDFFQPLQRLGAGVNGSTSTDRTNYYVDAPAAHVELVLAMESDRMGHLLPALTDPKLRVQKDVVKNEYRQNYANRPYGLVSTILAEALYPPTHPYSWLTIGVMEEIEAASRDDVEAFFRRYYVPSNASLALVGDLDEDRAFALAERYFGPIPGGAVAARPWTGPVHLEDDVRLRYHDRVELDRTYDVWHTVPQFHPDDAALTLLADVLGRGRASRLYEKLVVAEGLAQSVSVHHSGRELAGTFYVVVTLRPERSWQRARALVLDELRDLAEYGVRPEELARVQNVRVAGFLYALDNVGGFGGVADRLNAYNIYQGDPGRILSDLDRYRNVTAADLTRVASTYLCSGKRIALEVIGSKTGPIGVELDRSRPPRPAPAVAYRVPAPEVRTLSGGARLWALPRRDLPIVAATAVIAAGSGAHGPDRAGLAYLTAAVMDEGTERHNAHELALTVESMGASLTTSCGYDGSYVSFQCLTPHLVPTVELAVEVLRRPTFPTAEFERVRGQTLAALESERDSAEMRAHRALLRVLYGDGHPYGVPVDGTLRTVAGFRPDDVRAFHRRHYRPDRAAWVIAGDIDPDAAQELLERLLADWNEPAGPLPAPAGPPGPAPARSRLWLLDRPGSAQAVLRAGHVGVSRQDPAYADLLVFNQILGGQFTSRLNHRLREEKGYTYGVRSGFDFRRGAGPFTIAAALQSDRLAAALDDLRIEVEDLLGGRPPTPSELEDARRALIEGQARHFETPSALVSRFASLFLHGLPPDEHSRLPERLAGVTIDSMLAAARQHVRPDELSYVVVADAEQVAGPLEHLSWVRMEPFDEAV